MKSSYKLCILYFTYYTSINVHIIYNVFISVNQYFYEAKKNVLLVIICLKLILLLKITVFYFSINKNVSNSLKFLEHWFNFPSIPIILEDYVLSQIKRLE